MIAKLTTHGSNYLVSGKIDLVLTDTLSFVEGAEACYQRYVKALLTPLTSVGYGSSFPYLIGSKRPKDVDVQCTTEVLNTVSKTGKSYEPTAFYLPDNEALQSISYLNVSSTQVSISIILELKTKAGEVFRGIIA